MRVILIEKPKTNVNLADLSSFGESVLIFDADARRPAMFDVSRYLHSVREGLIRISFDPRTDALCMTGNLIQVTFMVAVATKVYGDVDLLMYSSVDCKYVKRHLSIEINGGLKDDKTMQERTATNKDTAQNLLRKDSLDPRGDQV